MRKFLFLFFVFLAFSAPCGSTNFNDLPNEIQRSILMHVIGTFVDETHKVRINVDDAPTLLQAASNFSRVSKQCRRLWRNIIKNHMVAHIERTDADTDKGHASSKVCHNLDQLYMMGVRCFDLPQELIIEGPSLPAPIILLLDSNTHEYGYWTDALSATHPPAVLLEGGYPLFWFGNCLHDSHIDCVSCPNGPRHIQFFHPHLFKHNHHLALARLAGALSKSSRIRGLSFFYPLEADDRQILLCAAAGNSALQRLQVSNITAPEAAALSEVLIQREAKRIPPLFLYLPELQIKPDEILQRSWVWRKTDSPILHVIQEIELPPHPIEHRHFFLEALQKTITNNPSIRVVLLRDISDLRPDDLPLIGKILKAFNKGRVSSKTYDSLWLNLSGIEAEGTQMLQKILKGRGPSYELHVSGFTFETLPLNINLPRVKLNVSLPLKRYRP